MSGKTKLVSMAAPSRSKASAIEQVPWRKPKLAPVILISGPEQSCADAAATAIRELVRELDPAAELSDLRADDYQPGSLLGVSAPSLFGEPRLVRVSNVEKCSDAFIEEAIAYLAAPQNGATVVVRHGGGVRGKKLLEAIRAASGTAIEIACPAIKKDSEKYEFAAAEFKAANKAIKPQALRALVDAFSSDLAELAASCRQLINDVQGEVTPEIVKQYYGGRVETTAFAVADAAIAGREGEALITLRHALDSGADPVPIVATFAMKLRTMALVAGARGSGGQIASELGMAPWQVDRAKRDLSGWNGDALALAIQATALADAQVKGAAKNPVFAVERLVSTVARRERYGA